MHGQAPEKTGPETGPPSYARRVRHIAESLEALSQLVTIGAPSSWVRRTRLWAVTTIKSHA